MLRNSKVFSGLGLDLGLCLLLIGIVFDRVHLGMPRSTNVVRNSKLHWRQGWKLASGNLVRRVRDKRHTLVIKFTLPRNYTSKMSEWNGGEYVDFHIVRDRKTVNVCWPQ